MPLDVAAGADVLTEALPASVQAKLTFAVRTADKPFVYTYDPPEGQPWTNTVYEDAVVTVENVRPIADSLSLDVEGVAVVRQPTAVRDLWDEAQILALGHPETAELVKQATGASRVVVFDHTLRNSAVEAGQRLGVRGRAQPPASRAHADQTVASGPKRVREIMGDQAEALLKRRARSSTSGGRSAIRRGPGRWRSATRATFAPADLVATDLIFRNRTGEIYGVAHNPGQRWLYVPDLGPDEAILIKCWDSDPGVARFAPHTASTIRRPRPARRRARASSSAPSPSSTEQKAARAHASAASSSSAARVESRPSRSA
ncbi:MAG: CmcJ/NvfI family oxidoreductase [Caulobacteraceae bacterium]